MKTIISASRRTDIPAFHSEWLLEKVKQEEVRVPNPFNGKKYTVSLAPSDVGAMVFWSKNYEPSLPVLNKIAPIYKRRFLFHFTITGYEGELKNEFEPKSPETQSAVSTMKELAGNFGREKIFWRFDPVLFTHENSIQDRLNKFEQLAQQLSDYCARCYFSFIDMYSKVKKRLKKHDIDLYLPDKSQKIDFADKLQKIAAQYDLPLYICCEPEIEQSSNIEQAHCIDSKYLTHLYSNIKFTSQIKPTRQGCGCFKSRDIGIYNTCQHNCLYCYANQ